MKVRKALIHELDEYDYTECFHANLGDGGLMQRQLGQCRAFHFGVAYIAENADNFLGWALVFNDGDDARSRYEGPAEKWPVSVNHIEEVTYFFVRHPYRRTGVGTALAEAVKKDQPKVVVMPWDDTSRAFFSMSFEPEYIR